MFLRPKENSMGGGKWPVLKGKKFLGVGFGPRNRAWGGRPGGFLAPDKGSWSCSKLKGEPESPENVEPPPPPKKNKEEEEGPAVFGALNPKRGWFREKLTATPRILVASTSYGFPTKRMVPEPDTYERWLHAWELMGNGKHRAHGKGGWVSGGEELDTNGQRSMLQPFLAGLIFTVAAT